MDRMLWLLVACLLMTGCGTNFVAAKKDLGLPPGTKPVLGVVAAKCVVNDKEGEVIDKFFATELVNYLNSNGWKAVMIERDRAESVSKAADTYSGMAKTWFNARDFDETTTFGDLSHDLQAAGADVLVILGGYAYSTTLLRQLTDFSLHALAHKLILGSMSHFTHVSATPYTSLQPVIINKEGKPLYYNKVLFHSIIRREFGSTADRVSMFKYIFDDVGKQVFL